MLIVNPIALRKAKIICNFGLSAIGLRRRCKEVIRSQYGSRIQPSAHDNLMMSLFLSYSHI